jgi:heme/copper-type cytochrome/quinol oxidase subunit 2
MEISLEHVWAAAAFLIVLESGAFTWRVTREVGMADRGEVNWLPPADVMNLVAMVVAWLGVFVSPIVGFRNAKIPPVALGLSIVLFAGYPFALAGHYELWTKGPRSCPAVYCSTQEIIAISFTATVAALYLGWSLCPFR